MLAETEFRQRLERQVAQARSPDERAIPLLQLGGLAERREDWQDAVRQYGKALDQGSALPGVAYYGNNNRGFSLIQLGRFDEAEPHCLAAIQVIPERHNAHKNLGLVRQGQERWAEAALCFVEAYRLCPRDVRAWHLLTALLASHPDLLRTNPGLQARVAALAGGHAESKGGLNG